MTHDTAQSLLGAAAVGSLPSDERAQLETHLSHCETCQGDLKELSDTATLLSTNEEVPPERVWEGIESQLGATPPPMRLAPVRSRPARAAWAAAAAIVLVVASSLVTLGVTGEDDTTMVAAPNQLWQNASLSAGARTTAMSDSQGRKVAEIIVLPSGQAYLRNIALVPLPLERTYQLWTLDGAAPVSAGLLGASSSTSAFAAGPGVTKLAITDETSRGVTAPSGTPVATATLDG